MLVKNASKKSLKNKRTLPASRATSSSPFKKTRVIINPMLNNEQTGSAGSHAVITFGRMNPPTTGHHKLVTNLIQHAIKHSGKPMVFLSHTQDKKKNPLSYEDKLGYARKAFGNVVQHSPHKTIIDVAKHVNKDHDHLTVMVGSDRVKGMHDLLHKYNGKPDHYNFKSINVVSAGERREGDSGVAGMSGSKLRNHAMNREYHSFKGGLPLPLRDNAREIYNKVRNNTNIKESFKDFISVQETDKEITTLDNIFSNVFQDNLSEKQIENLKNKSLKSEIDFDVLKEVYLRGYKQWYNVETNLLQEQYAFNRVNSFVSKGKSYYNEDSDLVEISAKKAAAKYLQTSGQKYMSTRLKNLGITPDKYKEIDAKYDQLKKQRAAEYDQMKKDLEKKRATTVEQFINKDKEPFTVSKLNQTLSLRHRKLQIQSKIIDET